MGVSDRLKSARGDTSQIFENLLSWSLGVGFNLTNQLTRTQTAASVWTIGGTSV